MLIWQDFVRKIVEMKSLSDKLEDGWLIQGETDVENGAYLVKKSRRHHQQHGWMTTEYHLVYDLSYAVPKLCFNIHKLDGSYLNLEQIRNTFNFDGKIDSQLILTQMDHPVLQMPFYTLHPCKTNEILGIAISNSKNLIVSWLSAIGPFVDLAIDIEYIKLT